MAPQERTHDISLIDHHVKDIETLCVTLNRALSAAFPRSSRSRYCDVYVLLISWENDDLGVATEIYELEVLFRDMYQYRTDQWKIPSTKSHNAVVRRIMQSLDEFESSNKLLIVYYGGHGYMNEDRQCVWTAAATVQWSSIQTNLEEADSDVLILLDCCAAASSAGGSGNGVTELIAACGFEAYAPGVGEHSFTRSLIEELKYYGQRPGPISTAFLHNKVLARAKNSWNPRYVSNGTQERRKTPIHIHLADRSKQRCIELTPLKFPPKLRDFFSLRLSDTQFFTPSSSPSEDTEMLDPSRSSQTSLDEVWPDPEHNSPKVLISVALEEDQFLRTEDWLDYLKSVPALAKSVRIESVFKSDSILLLLSLPVAIWDMLPKDPAISFVAFVKSGNFLDHRSSNEKVLEMKKRAQEESQVQTAQSINKRYVSPSRYSSPVSSYGSPDSRVIETTKAPTYIKIHRKYLEQGTLDEFKLPWERDRRDSNYFVIKRWMDENEQDELFYHTRKLREQRQIYNVTLASSKENEIYNVALGISKENEGKSYPR